MRNSKYGPKTDGLAPPLFWGLIVAQVLLFVLVMMLFLLGIAGLAAGALKNVGY